MDCAVFEVAQPELVAETLLSLGTIHRRGTQDHVPRVLQDAAAQVVRQIGLEQPLPVPLIVLSRPPKQPLSCSAKLGAAMHSNLLRKLEIREQLQERFRISSLGLGTVVGFLVILARWQRRVGMHLDWAAEFPGTSQGGEAGAGEVVDPKLLQDWHAVIERVLVVPLVAASVEEEDVPG